MTLNNTVKCNFKHGKHCPQTLSCLLLTKQEAIFMITKMEYRPIKTPSVCIHSGLNDELSYLAFTFRFNAFLCDIITPPPVFL